MPTPRATINQQVQIGPEVTPGTPVPCSKVLTAFTWTMGLKPATKQFRGTGRQHPSASAVLTEMSEGKLAGPGDFAQVVYILASLFGAPAPMLRAGTTGVYDWKNTPPLVGSYASNAKTYTVQMGDASDAEQYAFTVFTGFGYSFSRKQEVQFTAETMSQTFTEGVTLTASPTVAQQLPMVGAQFNVYLDTTSAGIGTTQLLDPMKVDFKASGYYDGYWPVNRANASYTNILDKEKKNELKLKLQANTTGIAIKANYLDTGAKVYIRVSGVGQVLEVDQIVGVGAATAGTFTLSYKGQTTAGIAYNASAATVQTAVQGLSTVGAGNAMVTGTAPNWTIRMAGALATDVTAMTGSGAGLTGGAFSLSSTNTPAAMTHDMVCFVTNMTEFDDDEGVYAVEYTFTVAEDTAWASGQAQVWTMTNQLSAL